MFLIQISRNGKFNEDILKIEKDNLKQVIEGKINDKDLYAFETCISKMYGDNGFGLFKYGKLEDIESIDAKELADHYYKLIQTAKIDFFVSGNLKNENVEEILQENENIKKLAPRSENYILNNEYTESKQKVYNIQEIQDLIQGSGGGVNGEIDASRQGHKGDCWLLAGIIALSFSQKGQAILQNAVTQTLTETQVYFKGLDK